MENFRPDEHKAGGRIEKTGPGCQRDSMMLTAPTFHVKTHFVVFPGRKVHNP